MSLDSDLGDGNERLLLLFQPWLSFNQVVIVIVVVLVNMVVLGSFGCVVWSRGRAETTRVSASE